MVLLLDFNQINKMSGYYYQDTNGYNEMQQYPGGYSQQNSMDEYMAPEEEWEREAVLDPAWERQQKKVYFVFFFVRFESISSLYVDIYCLV